MLECTFLSSFNTHTNVRDTIYLSMFNIKSTSNGLEMKIILQHKVWIYCTPLSALKDLVTKVVVVLYMSSNNN